MNTVGHFEQLIFYNFGLIPIKFDWDYLYISFAEAYGQNKKKNNTRKKKYRIECS